MKERPILFSGNMVRALLAGTKTQTRRPIKPQPVLPPEVEERIRAISPPEWRSQPFSEQVNQAWQDGFIPVACPCGQPGDRLWVRETWAYNGQASRNYGPEARRREGYVTYAADNAKMTHFFPEGPMLPSPPQDPPTRGEDEDEFAFATRTDDYYRTYFHRSRPSIHMPRWASRLTLEVTEVRVQRACEITEEDARAEGVLHGNDLDRTVYTDTDTHVSARDAFRVLLKSIYGPDAWEKWFWAVSFRVVR